VCKKKIVSVFVRVPNDRNAGHVTVHVVHSHATKHTDSKKLRIEHLASHLIHKHKEPQTLIYIAGWSSLLVDFKCG